MTIYIILLLLLLLGVFYFDIGRANQNRKSYYIVLGILLTIVPGFSYKVGIDTPVYMDFYNKCPDIFNIELSEYNEFIFEPFFVILNGVLKAANMDFVFVRLFCVLFLNLFIFRFVWKESKCPFSGILLYYLLLWLTANFESIRQSCGIGFYLWGCLSLINNDKKTFLLRSWPAIFFHRTGIIIIILTLLVCCVKINKKWIIGIFILFIISIISMSVFSDLYLLLNVLSNDIADSYNGYLNNGKNTGFVTSRNIFGFIIPFIVNILMPLLLSNIYWKSNRKMFARLLYLYSFLAVFQFSLGVVNRMMQYETIIYCIALSDLVIPQITKARYSMFGIFTIIAIFINIYTTNKAYFNPQSEFVENGADYRYFPYKSIFSSDKECYLRNSHIQRSLHSIKK